MPFSTMHSLRGLTGCGRLVPVKGIGFSPHISAMKSAMALTVGGLLFQAFDGGLPMFRGPLRPAFARIQAAMRQQGPRLQRETRAFWNTQLTSSHSHGST